MTISMIELPEPQNWNLPMIPEFPAFFKLNPIAKAVELMVMEEYGDKFLHSCATTIALQLKEYFGMSDDLVDLLRINNR